MMRWNPTICAFVAGLVTLLGLSACAYEDPLEARACKRSTECGGDYVCVAGYCQYIAGSFAEQTEDASTGDSEDAAGDVTDEGGELETDASAEVDPDAVSDGGDQQVRFDQVDGG